jgi:hypothetical protein
MMTMKKNVNNHSSQCMTTFWNDIISMKKGLPLLLSSCNNIDEQQQQDNDKEKEVGEGEVVNSKEPVTPSPCTH